MKNHPVNNDYVQTLIEGLLNEECSQPLSIDESKAHIKRQLKSKKISPVEKARLKAKLDAKEHDSEKRKEVAQEAADEEFGESGGHHAKMDLWAGNDQGNIRDQGGAERKPKKVKGAKTPKPLKNAAGRVLKPIEENFLKSTGNAIKNGARRVGAALRGEIDDKEYVDSSLPTKPPQRYITSKERIHNSKFSDEHLEDMRQSRNNPRPERNNPN